MEDRNIKLATPLKSVNLPGIDDYSAQHTTADSAGMAALVQETYESLTTPQMLSGPVVARFLQLLIHAIRPRLVVDVGTYSGYSALSMAAALPPGGHIVTCELNEHYAAAANRHIIASPYADRITVRQGLALDTLSELEGPFDFVFIDADKVSYSDYFQAALPKLASHGLIACDNTLREGEILNPLTDDPGTRAMRSFNDALVNDPRVSCVLLPVRDGITLIRRNG